MSRDAMGVLSDLGRLDTLGVREQLGLVANLGAGADDALPSYANSSLEIDDWNPPADGTTAATLTLTERDTDGDLMPARAITRTYALTAVDAAESTLVSDTDAIDEDTGVANLTLHVRDADGTPLPNIPAAEIVFASTGTGNTFTPVDAMTDKNGRFRATFESTDAETKTITVTVIDEELAAEVEIEVGSATPVAPLFSSDWSTATGQGNAAVLDTDNALDWTRVGSAPGTDVLTVIASTGLDFPTTNVLQVDLDYNGDGTQNTDTQEVSLLPGAGAWPIPGVGDWLYFRFYKRMVYANVLNLGANNHSVENRSGGSTNWSWIFVTNGTGFSPRLQIWRGAGDLDRYILGSGGTPTYLALNTTYRFEFAFHRTGTNLRETHVRIYNSAGTLLYDSDDFYLEASPGTVLTGQSTGYSNVNTMDGLQLGTNGPHIVGLGADVIPAWYFGAVAVRANDWCGPYSGGV